jgi:hypothetical protein
MGIVKSESISDRGHLLNILSHMLPKIGTVRRLVAVSEFYTIAPNVDSSSQIIPSFVTEIFHAIPAANPPVVSDLRFPLIFLAR